MASQEEGTSHDRQRPQEVVDNNELAFLVTHWLRNYTGPNINNSNNNGNAEGGATQTATADASTPSRAQQEALERIQRAASDLASAFSTLGTFGTATVPALSISSESGGTNNSTTTASSNTNRNATFSDMNRRWGGLPSNHLGNLVTAAVSSTLAAAEVVDRCAESNLVHAANEAVYEQRRNPTSGRTVQDAINLDATERENKESTIVPVKQSLLQRPAQVTFNLQQLMVPGDSKIGPRSESDPINMPLLDSQITQLQSKSSEAMRQYLDLKEKYNTQTTEIASLKSSLRKRLLTVQELQRKRIPATATLNPIPQVIQISEEEHDANRVIPQLQRKISELEISYAKVTTELAAAKVQAYSQFNNAKKSLLCYRDPLDDANRLRSGFGMRGARNNGIFRSIENRRSGLPIYLARTHALEGTGTSTQHAMRTKKAVISRLSHSITINSHLNWPIYCFCFDKTGKYFCTGADDMLVRVFCLGAKQAIDSTGKGRLGPGHENTMRGAMLVHTLRGHASVINYMDVSSDNSFLATASDDGDCRVWGLKDGAPVAILRGHDNGCTAVKWSKLCPYRLVTTGEDGFARSWDIREAALKRYGTIVGKRPEYMLKLTEGEKLSKRLLNENLETTDIVAVEVNLAPPPLPERPHQPENNTAAGAPILPAQVPLQPLPPSPAAAGGGLLPGAAPENQQAPGDDAAAEAAEDGRFVANAEIDEGVTLVAKFQHGKAVEERMVQPGTRSRRAAVKVLSVDRSPLGNNQFSTGGDDGIVRVWEDAEDGDVEMVDHRSCKSAFDCWPEPVLSNSKQGQKQRSSRGASNRLLLQLKGHMNAITDLNYSNAGDRIMSGSQKDGVVRLWSWDIDPIIPDSELPKKDRGLRHIVIKLTNPMVSAAAESRKARRRGASGAAASTASTIELDTAVWSSDDTRIITSQSQPIKKGIVPNSNFVFVWDSRTGHCLLGIAQPHAVSVQVLLPHPTDPSIFCSAGKELKVWDIETGKCIFHHENDVGATETVAHGQVEKSGVYLDGSFLRDSTGIILTDYNGRISIFDCTVRRGEDISSLAVPQSYQLDQYFSTDYRDLFYDTNGYCVEKGSGLPPHLAPRGARCSESRAPYDETVRDAFKKLTGPLPLPVRDCQWQRECLRSHARVVLGKSSVLRNSPKNRRGNVMQEFDPLTTILLRSTGEILQTKNNQGEVLPVSVFRPAASPTRASPAVAVAVAAPGRGSISEPSRTSNSGRPLSSNYRWQDYNDMMENEREMMDEDEDDEEFELPSRNNRASAFGGNGSEDDDEDLVMFDAESPSPQRSTQRSRQAPRHRQAPRPRQPPTRRIARNDSREEVLPSRASSRRRASSHRYSDPDSDEDEFESEVVSTNNDPSGPHVEDYSTHYFRIPKTAPFIARQWLRRIESDSGFVGRKMYVPQVGDSVVYIPRAHLDTIETFPTLNAPWQHWPAEAEWPVVKCRVRDMRYRFPFTQYFGSRLTNSSNKCESIVAILTLEVTGIPVLSHQERAFSWPDPKFIPPAKSHFFDLALFSSKDLEECILPHDRYKFRLQCLEEALNTSRPEGTTEVSAYYDDEDNDTEDSDLILYQGRVDDHGQRDRDYQDSNLTNCGFRALNVRWTDSTQSENRLSPWEVIVEKSKKYEFNRKNLSEEEKRMAHDALKKIKRIPDVREQFIDPVNERRYSDYNTRVEVKMHLSFIEKRLDSNFYSSRLSVVFDVKLIRDNCIKYNGEIGALQDSARQMYDEFESEMLSEAERNAYNNLEATADIANVKEVIGSRSSLENLPPPAEPSGSRRSLRIRIDVSQSPRQAPIRATRANPGEEEVAGQDTSFANARARRPRRRSNDEAAAAGPIQRPGRGSASVASARQPPVRQSSRTQISRVSLDSRSALEAPPGRRRIHRTSPQDDGQNNIVAAAAVTARQMRPQYDNPSSGSESDAKPAARPTRGDRHAARSREDSSESEEKEDSESESVHQLDDKPSGLSARDQRASLRDNESQDDSPQKRIRKRKAQKTSLSEDEEDDEVNVSSDAESKAEHAKPRSARAPTRQSASASSRRSASRASLASSTKISRRASAGNKVSYAENSESSEFEESASEEEEDESLQNASPRKRVARSRKAASPSARSSRGALKGKKRRKADSEDEEDDDDDDSDHDNTVAKRRKPSPRLRGTHSEPWADIDAKKITHVTKHILGFFRSNDMGKIFENPVVESYPDIRVSYLAKVLRPMCFRTIEDERVNYYKSITELQKDLNLCFHNCIAFNGAASDFGKLSEQMLGLMDDAFLDAVDSANLSD